MRGKCKRPSIGRSIGSDIGLLVHQFEVGPLPRAVGADLYNSTKTLKSLFASH